MRARGNALEKEHGWKHSYRYAWAERAKANAYPERFAQEALGHNSKAVHRAYARKARPEIPALGINIHRVEWSWQYREAPGFPWRSFDESRHRIYTVLRPPTAPWFLEPFTASNMQLPWTDKPLGLREHTAIRRTSGRRSLFGRRWDELFRTVRQIRCA